MAKSTGKTANHMFEFIGPPRRLVAVGQVPELAQPATITGPVAKLLSPGRQSLRVRRAGRRAAGMNLRLAPQTPPGNYKGKISAGKASHSFTARVLANTSLDVLTGALDFSGPPGARPVVTLAFANNGNTDVALPRAIAVALFDDDGIESAFAASYAKPRDTMDAFVSAFHGRLRQAHTGILKLAIARGFGTHGPATTFSADFRLTIPAEIGAGRRFHGIASTEYFDLPISLSVTNGAV